MNREHRTLNLIWWAPLRFMRPAVSDIISKSSMNRKSRGLEGFCDCTFSIFSPTDLDELLDVRDFARHGGRVCVKYEGGVGA